MAIKWKKRNVSIVVLYVAAISFLLTGLFGFARGGAFSGNFRSCAALLRNSDFQKTGDFQNFISSRLSCFLRMACGDYVSDNGYYSSDSYVMGTDTSEYMEAVAEEGAMAAESDEAEWQDSAQKNQMAKEKKASADAFHNRIQQDKNILYRISYQGTECYSNMDEISWQYEEGRKDLPEGYNFLLYFDGTKAVIQKDGKETDIYGDGIYREEEDWYLPGYKNYPGKEKWGKAKIVILAAEEPVLYTGDDTDDGYWLENDFYYLYQNYVEERNQIRSSTAYFCLGLILLACYLYFRREKREAGKYLAKLTAGMWFEWKALLFFVLPVIFFLCLINREGAYGVWEEYASELGYAGVGMTEYVSELTGYVLSDLWYQRTGVLFVFWLLYLFFCDLRNNRGSCKNGIFGRFAATLEQKSFSLPLSKRMMKRSYGILFLTLAQLCFFLGLLVFILAMRYRIEWIYPYGVVEWISGIASVSLVITAALLITEYIWQKKNHRTALDLEQLSQRISVIRDGNYDDEKAIAAEDADIRRMASELEDIRKGLETAVEERTGSERMKVELVANVSHDLKTPLTSIISYIELLKQEEDLPEHVRDYICILDEKSERLRNMVQDVFAVSKAASGQLPVEEKELDLGKLLYQTLADMEETIQKAPVTIKTEIPKEPVLIKSDGGRIYRVFQNLIGNAVKYSLEGSRVYISLEKEGNLAVASVKNTSSRELNRQTDFTERFVRGDVSRTDGGSGLGLSIAKSFTEACGGTFQLETIADLFVVTVSFQMLE